MDFPKMERILLNVPMLKQSRFNVAITELCHTFLILTTLLE